MSNITAADTETLLNEQAHWTLTTLAHFDTWCGTTCHALLRYLLRSILILVLVGTFATIIMRAVDPKQRAEVRRRSGLSGATALLEQSGLGSGGETRKDGGIGAQAKKETRDGGGPDVKDSCAVM